MSAHRVVLLVDHKRRDLRGCALIATHLRELGIETFLEPINAWQAVLGAYKPDLIVFNHTTREHLADYTERLAAMGVITAVLPNEGINYHEEVLAFNSARHHDNLHLDHFLCWNEVHQRCLLDNGYAGRTHVEVVGVPRFDFYFEPWRRVFTPYQRRSPDRPRLLVCTNFGFAEFKDRPREMTERFFSQWKGKIPLYNDYWEAIEANARSRNRFFDFLRVLLASDRYEVILKTHPRESREPYLRWLETLPTEHRAQLVYADLDAELMPLMLACDLEISCESCTTALEAWIAGKPTIELTFEKHPIFYHEHVSKLTPLCDSPDQLVDLVDAELAAPEQESYASGRRDHLQKWCASPDGRASERVARAIASALERPSSAKNLRLNFEDHRRALKLHAYRAIGQPYTFFPLLQLRHRLSTKRYSKKLSLYDKSVTPGQVREAMQALEVLKTQGSS